eukprot:73980-Lingulodinium_polyedra.AAC.1
MRPPTPRNATARLHRRAIRLCGHSGRGGADAHRTAHAAPRAMGARTARQTALGTPVVGGRP